MKIAGVLPRGWGWIGVGLACNMAPLLLAQDWLAEVQPPNAGEAVALRPTYLFFEFGWSGLPAGWAGVNLDFQPASAADSGRYEVSARGGSTGLARTLWKMDATFWSVGSLPEFRPGAFVQTEFYRSHRIEIEASFQPDSVRRRRQRRPSAEEAPWRSIQLPALRDLAGTMLFVRSQPLLPGDKIVLLCFPGDAPYLVRLHVVGTEQITWRGEPTQATRLDLELQRVGTKGTEKGLLLPHRRFRHASIWLAQDDQRLPLLARADLIFGYIYGELLSAIPLNDRPNATSPTPPP